MKKSIQFAVARLVVLALASLLMAVNYRTFVEWGGLYPAGATGLSMLLQRVLQRLSDAAGFGWTVPFSLINFALNAIPVWIGFRFIGRRFTLYSLYVIFLTGFFTDIMPVDALTSFVPANDLMRLKTDPFVTSLFGGVSFGFGMALCLRWNATTGGTDFIAIYLSETCPSRRGARRGTSSSPSMPPSSWRAGSCSAGRARSTPSSTSSCRSRSST